MDYKIISINEKLTVVECNGNIIQISTGINIEEMLSKLILDNELCENIDIDKPINKNMDSIEIIDNKDSFTPTFRNKKTK